MLSRALVAAALLALAVILLPTPAAAEGLFDGLFGIARPYLAELAMLAVTALIGWIAALIRRWTGIEIEAKHREALQGALHHGVDWALNRLGERLGAGETTTRERAIGLASDYVRDAVPDAISHFGLSPQRLQALVEARLPPPEPVAKSSARPRR